MNTLIVPLDGSTIAERVLPHVLQLAPLLRLRVRLLQIIQPFERDDTMLEVFPLVFGSVTRPEQRRAHLNEAEHTMRAHAEAYLDSKARELSDHGLQVSTEVSIGSPAEMIIEAASEEGASLIAMATHGYSGIKRWALGSVTDRVVHASSIPVFVAHGEPQAAGAAPTLRRVLVPLDGSQFAEQALPLAVDLARSAGAELLLLKAIETRGAPELHSFGRSLPEMEGLLMKLQREALAKLEQRARHLREEGLAVRTLALVGDAAEMIVDQAHEQQADLIVMATHGYSGLQRWTLGSIADKALHASRTPLLLVRPHGR